MPFVSQSAMKTYWVVDYLKLKCSCIDSRNPALKSTSARAHVINLCWILSYYGMKLPLCIELCTIPQRQESLCNSGKTPPEGDKLEAFCSLLRVETASIKWNKCAMTHIILLEVFLCHVAVDHMCKLTSVCPLSSSFPGVRHCVHCGLCAVLVGSLVLKEVISSATVGTSSISWWTERAAWWV